MICRSLAYELITVRWWRLLLMSPCARRRPKARVAWLLWRGCTSGLAFAGSTAAGGPWFRSPSALAASSRDGPTFLNHWPAHPACYLAHRLSSAYVGPRLQVTALVRFASLGPPLRVAHALAQCLPAFPSPVVRVRWLDRLETGAAACVCFPLAASCLIRRGA